MVEMKTKKEKAFGNPTSFGDVNFPKHLTEHNAWIKDYDYQGGWSNENRTYVYRNGITKEQRPLTEAQYRDSNYTINTGE